MSQTTYSFVSFKTTLPDFSFEANVTEIIKLLEETN